LQRIERVQLEAYGVLAEVAAAGGATVLQTPAAPGSPMLNRVVGLGVDRPATEQDVDAALAAIGAGVTFYVAVSPHAEPAELPRWLGERGLEPGWGWMSFSRDPDHPPRFATSLRLALAESAAEAAAFARIQRIAYDLPEELEPVLALAPERGWECWLALDGDEPAGAGAVFARDDVCYLGLGATLPEHRGKGAQGALLAQRIRRAGELGCDLVVTETGERRDDRPSSSYRNILRAGFVEGAVTANWLGTRQS
jgi:GNAT superfamily N-acetyltransferase